MKKFSLKQLEKDNKILIILDIANNHQGDIQHGLDIINQCHEIIKDYSEFLFSFKFQYRDIKNSFIHKDFKDRMDIKYVKRFIETFLTDEEFLVLKNRIEDLGYLTSVTSFDNASISKIIEQNFNFIKIASVSFDDWILLDDIIKIDKPIILSTASQSLEIMKNVYDFFKHRDKDFAFLHCRGLYPTYRKDIELNQIDLLKKEFDIPIGFSSHEDLFENDNIVKLAIAKGSIIFERHVDIDCKTKNNYSIIPNELLCWLDGIKEALEICGVKNKRYKEDENENKSLSQFKRGLFTKELLFKNQKLTKKNTYVAWPADSFQLYANDFSKYIDFKLNKNIKKDSPIFINEINTYNRINQIKDIYDNVKKFIKDSKITIPKKFEMEISHHFGLEKFYETGAVIVTLYNNEYAKKLLVMLSNQYHPQHYHIIKKESFFILFGELDLYVYNNDIYNTMKIIKLKEGDQYTLERNVPHAFKTYDKGCIFEEVSTEAVSNDSFYNAVFINNNKARKTKIIFSK